MDPRVRDIRLIIVCCQTDQLSNFVKAPARPDLAREKRIGSVETEDGGLSNVSIALIRVHVSGVPTGKPSRIDSIKLHFGQLQHFSDPFTFAKPRRTAIDPPTPGPIKSICGVNLTSMKFGEYRRQMAT